MKNNTLIFLGGLGVFILGVDVMTIIINKQKLKAAKQLLDYDLESTRIQKGES